MESGVVCRKYRAVLLDIDDTVFDFSACSRAALEKTCAALNAPFTEKAFSAFLAIDGRLWAEQKRGALSVEGVLLSRNAEMCAFLGCAGKEEPFDKLFRGFLSETTVFVEGAADAVAFLSGKAKLFAASNGKLETQKKRLQRAGLAKCFSGAFVSDDVGFEKPDARFFEACLQKSGFDRGETLMVGDSFTADIAGAAQCGIDGCWFNAKGGAASAARYTIRRLADLKDLPCFRTV